MNDRFVKIEDKIMPVDNFKDINLNNEKNFQSGFTSLIFLAGIIATCLMWIIMMSLGR